MSWATIWESRISFSYCSSTLKHCKPLSPFSSHIYFLHTWFINLLITRRKVFLADLMVLQAVEKVPACHGTWTFITVKHFIIQPTHTTWKCTVIKTYQNYEGCPNMIRFTVKPSSGNHNQYLAKNTGLVQCRYRRCQCYGGILCRHNTDVCIYIEPSL
jgi:hypothetical protein